MLIYEGMREMEESFANYILEEKDWVRKMEIMYYLERKTNIFFDKSVILKTEIAKLFIDIMNIKDIDENYLITACLLCNCKKPNGFGELKRLKTYAKDGAVYLEKLGFEKRFCKICEEVNRYSKSEPRENESDILEIVDHFGGMLLDRYDRASFKPDEALLLLEYRNLKNKPNKYLELFIKFVEEIQRAHIGLNRSLEYLSKLLNTTRTTKMAIVNAYNSKVEIEEAVQNLKNKPKDITNEEIINIKINPEDIETLVLRKEK